MKRKITLLIILTLIPLIVGFASYLLTRNAMMDFANFSKPPLAPPAVLFPIAWTLLYLLMGISSFLIASKNATANIQIPLIIYSLQLAVNFSWSIVFFRLGMRWTAVGILIVLWLLVFVMMCLYRNVSKMAALLTVPYLLWLTFALYLNIGTAILNH